MRFMRSSLRWRLSVLIACACLVTAVIAVAGFSWRDLNRFRDHRHSAIQAITSVIADQSGAALTLGDRRAASEVLSALRADSGIRRAVLYDIAGACFAAFSRSGESNCAPHDEKAAGAAAGTVVFTSEVLAGGDLVGGLLLVADEPAFFAVLEQYLGGAVLVLAFSLVLAGLLGIALQSRVSSPILNVAEVARSIAHTHHFEERVAFRSPDELGVLAASLNTLLDEIQRRDAELAVQRLRLEEQLVERNLVAEELRRAKDRAEDADRLKSQFLANMSHEIRTPMNGIMGMTELALHTDLSPDQREYLTVVKISADSLLTVINDVLDFSKIEAGRLSINALEFDLRGTVDRTLKSLALRAHEKNLELICDVGPDTPERVVGDPQRLGQVLTNLVGNAVKFTHSGEITVRMDVEGAEAGSPVLHFAVSDTGIGIPQDKQAHVFEPFVQADGSITREFGGTGLGLAISSQLVKMMGGRIWLESAETEGSTFYFTLPCASSESPDGTKALGALLALNGVRVLVVDDNRASLRVLHEAIQRYGMSCSTALNAEEGDRMLREAQAAGQPFQIALVDARMSPQDGFALAADIQQDPSPRETTVILMLSSSDLRAETGRRREIGSTRYLTKPVSQSELRQALLDAISGMPQSGEMAEPRNEEASVASLRILVAEDNLINQKLAARLLEKAGHSVTLAPDGQAALDELERREFDVVLMDVQMPRLDGIETTRAIRRAESGQRKRLPIIATTAHAMKGDIERCLEAGMDDYVSKPIDAQELHRKIAEVMRSVTCESYLPADVDSSGISK